MEDNRKHPRISRNLRKSIVIGFAAVTLFSSGVAVGMAIRHGPRPVIMAALSVTPLERLAMPASFLTSEVVAVTGRVTEKFDDFVVIQDDSGKAGFSFGGRSSIADLIQTGSTITIQGVIEPRGLVPSFVVLPGNRTISLTRGRDHAGHRHQHGR